MTPILGNNAVIQFYKVADYFPYACCESFELAINIETRSVKTVGDGVWEKVRGKSIGYSLTLNGLILLDEDDEPMQFDLLAKALNFEEVQFRLIYEDTENTLLKIIEGSGVVSQNNIVSPTEGFANSSFEIIGNGALSVRDTIDTCTAAIGSSLVGVDGANTTLILLSVTGSPFRYDYTIDGGGVLTEFTTTLNLGVLATGSHNIQVTPVCVNGLNGTVYNTTITV